MTVLFKTEGKFLPPKLISKVIVERKLGALADAPQENFSGGRSKPPTSKFYKRKKRGKGGG